MLAEGGPAPGSGLTSDAGETVTFASLRRRPVVVHFQPEDDALGCTTRARGIRDAWAAFERSGTVVLGVGPDGAASHVRLGQKPALPFTLLPDPDHGTADSYGVWVERSLDGKRSMGVERSTFVTESGRTLTKVLRTTKPDTRTGDVLAVLGA